MILPWPIRPAWPWMPDSPPANSGPRATPSPMGIRITRNTEGLTVNFSWGWEIPGDETVQTVFDLVADEGLVLGSSSGINVAGAVRLARELGPGHVIVTILCDSGTRYTSRLFNPDFLRANNLPAPPWLAVPRSMLPEGVLIPVPATT